MVASPSQRFWTRRLRWRLRGAMQWPAFVFFTLIEAVVLDRLPPVGTDGPNPLNPVSGLLIATFANLFLVGALAPFLARRLAGRTQVAPAGPTALPDVEREVTRDRTATALLGIGLLACIVSGLANRPVIVSETKATEQAAVAVRDFVRHTGDEQLARNLETANTARLGEGFFRTCIARDDRRSFFCLLVDTEKRPTKITRDPSAEPNSAVTGP
ncbi:hypothetical protein BH20ACT19_BH20ACT19_12070 [soil metagenome]